MGGNKTMSLNQYFQKIGTIGGGFGIVFCFKQKNPH
jgi:hypothetical protein